MHNLNICGLYAHMHVRMYIRRYVRLYAFTEVCVYSALEFIT
jgi:hypothetical protein